MIISRTPFRISFFGGGTDYPAWYREHGGAVLASAIDKYCYISCRYLPPFFEHKYRIVYSRIENVMELSEIEHPAVRAVLQWMNCVRGLEVHHDGDLPARSGLGSSSSFTVGLINVLMAMKGLYVTKEKLAQHAIHVEQDLIRENVGSQDQVSAAYGGFNKIEFRQDGTIDVSPVILRPERREMLEAHLMMFFTGISRYASDVAKAKMDNLKDRKTELRMMRTLVDEALSILARENDDLDDFGKLLDENWQYKRKLSDKVTTPEIDRIYETAMAAGALGGKLLGAGGGGFLMFFARPEQHAAIREKLKELIYVPVKFDTSGSKIVMYQPNGLG
ncbi:MAG: GHMP family kinase ATP-binding protein [Burkholderiales bacterium]